MGFGNEGARMGSVRKASGALLLRFIPFEYFIVVPCLRLGFIAIPTTATVCC